MQRTGLVMIAVAWLLIGGGVWLVMDGWLTRQHVPSLRLVDGDVVLSRNAAGHYVAPGEINGVPVLFLVDTGATRVAFSTATAARVGAERGTAMRAQTAQGETISYATRLDSVSLGDMVAHNVGGAIVPAIPDDTVLLGMSFLSRFNLSMTGDSLRLSPR